MNLQIMTEKETVNFLCGTMIFKKSPEELVRFAYQAGYNAGIYAATHTATASTTVLIGEDQDD